jgi:predicted dehydrogenase
MTRNWTLGTLTTLMLAVCAPPVFPRAASGQPVMRIGIIGLDTSHAIAFTREFHDESPTNELADMRVVAAYPPGSPDIESSVKRVPEYTRTIQDMGVEIVDSIDALLERVDAVLLETNDGRPHLEQALPVLRAGKPLFIDKPLAGSLTDAVAIFWAAEHFRTPVFSSSSLRYIAAAQQARQGAVGDVTGCDAHSPCSLEPTHPDLYWYGIHGVELLFTVMGTGCQSVQRVSTPGTDLVVGQWDGGRVGTFRGLRPPGTQGYGGRVFGTAGIQDLGSYEGYRPLVLEIGRFFRTGQPPVPAAETLEIFAFMSAADESLRRDGQRVLLSEVMEAARSAATTRLAELLTDRSTP